MAALPARMGTPFRWLVGSAWVSNLGDGIGLVAFPLLVAAQTRDPVLVALAGLLQRLPWLLFGLYAGVVADRVDRRRLVVAVDAARATVLAVLCATVVTGTVDVRVVLVTAFVFGSAEVFSDTATSTLLPMVVDRRDLGIGNARLMTGMVTMNQLAGPGHRRRALRRRPAVPLRHPGAVRGAGRAARLPDAGARCRRGRLRERAPAPRHRRGLPLDVGQRPGAHADAGDRHLQRHLRRRLVGARALGAAAARASARSASACSPR